MIPGRLGFASIHIITYMKELSHTHIYIWTCISFSFVRSLTLHTVLLFLHITPSSFLSLCLFSLHRWISCFLPSFISSINGTHGNLPLRKWQHLQFLILQFQIQLYLVPLNVLNLSYKLTNDWKNLLHVHYPIQINHW